MIGFSTTKVVSPSPGLVSLRAILASLQTLRTSRFGIAYGGTVFSFPYRLMSLVGQCTSDTQTSIPHWNKAAPAYGCFRLAFGHDAPGSIAKSVFGKSSFVQRVMLFAILTRRSTRHSDRSTNCTDKPCDRVVHFRRLLAQAPLRQSSAPSLS